ncbi:MAG: hypothetical protein SVO96_02925 [Pseudomonadota bacterium]|nr:hypothetical protein [Pseudomonadota bacterium]
MDTIYTLDARGNIFLESIRDHFQLSSDRMHGEIRTLFSETLDGLDASGIKYEKLKSALVPSTKREEIALLFDSSAIESCAYGHEVLCRVLPLLDNRTTQSVLVGDLIGENKDQEFIFQLLRDSLAPARNFTFVHSTLIYCVYLNNLSFESVKRIVGGLMSFNAFIGFVHTTYNSKLKAWLSLGLCNLFVKCGKDVVIAHEDDRPNSENVNITMYPFEDFGYVVRSIQQQHFSHFLSYKIECEVFSWFESDIDFSLNAITPHVGSLTEFEILFEERKFEHLKDEKAGSFRKAGLEGLGLEEVKNLIRRKIASNYIYNLRYLSQHDVMLFNIMLEIERADGGHPSRMLVSLEYRPLERILRVVTMH